MCFGLTSLITWCAALIYLSITHCYLNVSSWHKTFTVRDRLTIRKSRPEYKTELHDERMSENASFSFFGLVSVWSPIGRRHWLFIEGNGSVFVESLLSTVAKGETVQTEKRKEYEFGFNQIHVFLCSESIYNSSSVVMYIILKFLPPSPVYRHSVRFFYIFLSNSPPWAPGIIILKLAG